MEALIGIFIAYLILFPISIYLKDNSIVDIFWGI
jgi:steroid 5-alpha reductase family enzyme